MTEFQPTAASPASRRRARLLWGASLATLITASAAQGAHAQSVGALMAATHQVTQVTAAAAAATAMPPAPGTAAAMAAASARALRYQTQLNSAQNLAQQAQAAAQAAARALNQNLAAHIADGLAPNGLVPAVTQITPASADPTGLATWQGANLPTAAPSNPDQVTVQQTAQRAVLSWTTFNVGQNTTLTFQQQNANWVALNRIVGGIDPSTGLLRNATVSPTQILGSIKATGTILVLDQNGILFGPTSQVNVGSLIATSLEIGRAADIDSTGTIRSPLSIPQHNSDFLNFGILGYGQQTPFTGGNSNVNATFSAQESPSGATSSSLATSTVEVQRGASLTSADAGYLLLLAPNVVNAGQLTSADGEVALQSGTGALLTASTGGAGSADPGVRGLVVTAASDGGVATPSGTVVNAAYGVIDAPRSYISLGGGTVNDYGAILSTTSISQNGYINIFGQTITVGQDPGDAKAPAPVIAIGPDSSTATLPQDPTTLQSFQSSVVRIGRYTFDSQTAGTTVATGSADILLGSGSLIYAPGGAINIGADLNPKAVVPGDTSGSLVVQNGAAVDAAGLTDVAVPASRNAIEISPVKGNELANSPAFRNGFLNGATVFLDPRLSGVNANGVAWVGSPLIAAAAYAQQIGEPVTELMVKGGNIALGAPPAAPNAPSPANAATFNIQPGAVIDISGGWKTYQAGNVQQTYLVDATGQVIPISRANPDDTYVAVYNGYIVSQPRWGVSRTYMDPLLTGSHFEGQYTEGQDAGSLTLNGPVVGFDPAFYAGAFAGTAQLFAATPGTSRSSISGDVRLLQAVPSQLPAGGYLDVNAVGGGDIGVAGGSYVVGGYTPEASASTSLSADALSGSGLSQLTLQTSGKIGVGADASLTLAPGGAFVAIADRTITVDGSITIPSGVIELTTVGNGTPGQTGQGSTLSPEPNQLGAYDVVINGALSVAGRWVNDFNASAGQLTGPSYLGGGSINVTTAANLSIADPVTPTHSQDISGSIVINSGAQLNLSGGGYVNPAGGFTLTANGGNLTLLDATTLGTNPVPDLAILYSGGQNGTTIPYFTSRVSIADGSILDAGFGGGGTFSLTAPYFSFAASSVVPGSCGGQAGTVCGAALPLSFFSTTGFASYDIVSSGTKFILTPLFDTSNGRFSTALETQVAEVQSGQVLSLTQSYFSPILSVSQIAALQNLGTGGDLYSVLTPAIPADAWDQKPVSLSLQGLLELHVDQGGSVIGAQGSAITVSELYNQGTIRIPGGTITQSETNFNFPYTIGVTDLSKVFGNPLPDGTYDPNALNSDNVTAGQGRLLTNMEVATSTLAGGTPNINTPIYFLGDLGVGVAVDLAPGSVTDLSAQAIVNPRATTKGGIPQADFVDGVLTSGGSFIANGVSTGGAAKGFVAEPGATLDLSGAQTRFDRPSAAPSASAPSYTPTLVWSNGGNLTLGEGGVIAGATISAQGGAPLALGGILDVSNAQLYAGGTTAPAFSAAATNTPLNVADIASAAFSTFVSEHSLTSVGDATLRLPRAVFVEGTRATATLGGSQITLGSGGRLEIDAPYIALDGASQTVITVNSGVVGSNSLTLNANAIDVTGSVLFDQSIGQATLSANGDIRLVGVGPAPGDNSTTVIGQLAANGNLTLASAQIYPTTGTAFTLETTGVSSPGGANSGTIAFKGVGAAPATPYSAGGSLDVAAAIIDQGGVVRVPLGQLTLGSNAPVTTGAGTVLVPQTATVTLDPGSITSVSADGLNIPYGTTTDQVEWFFTPTQAAALTAPPAGVLHVAGGSITAASGASVDLSGGGDVYAFEFVAGKGGTRDVLDQLNPDQFSSNNGYQYPDKRQIYAIVPGLSNAPVAAIDPIYSSGYSALYGPSQAGLSVYLNAAPGVAAGWYTLLPAKYALLPGGMRVVQDTGASTPAPAGGDVLSDGTIVTSGYFGVAGVNTRGATPLVFDVQSQSTVLNESKIAQTRGNAYFTALAAHAGNATPRLPIDAGRLILSPLTGLTLDATFDTTPANLAGSATAPALTGRGSEVDISGTSLVIDTTNPSSPPASGVIDISTANLANLNAASLLIGGTRTDNADGTTSLVVSSNTITVQGGVSLGAPELILATDGPAASLTVANGASLVATGAVTGESSGAYVIEGLVLDANGKPVPDPNNPNRFLRVQDGQGGVLRVSNGPERLVTRMDVAGAIPPGTVAIGDDTQPGAGPLLQGHAVEVASTGDVSLSASTQLAATDLALAAASITFATSPPQGATGLFLTPGLQAQLANAQSVTLQSQAPIQFSDSATYQFNALTLDSPGLAALANNAVGIKASGTLSIANSSAGLGPCAGTAPLACGAGSFELSANAIVFGSGAIQTYGSDSGVTLNAAAGVFADGAATFGVGAATLAINAPFIGDRGTGIAGATQPSLTLTTTGAVTIASATPASSVAAPAGTPGSSLEIDGASVSISGGELRATAGRLTIKSNAGIAISGGALLATPSYAKTFGDAADSTTVSAPGGLLSLTALAGDISVSDDSRLAIGGAQGGAGALSLVAQNGSVQANLVSTVSAAAPGGGASLVLDTGGAFDLSAFASALARQFTGSISVRTQSGDLKLAAGDSLTATDISLTADGGGVVVGGAIDTSGINGGAISLYGATGVELTSGSLIKALANGYGLTSTLQAHGGAVTLGVDQTGTTVTDPTTGEVQATNSGAISIDPGATIDVSAKNTGARLVNMNRTGGATDYTYVAGDVGGVVTFRAPVITQNGGQTVNVSVQGSVNGASGVVLDAFKRFDLATMAANPGYQGVTANGGTVTLNLSQTGGGLVNPLADLNGPVVQFIQTFGGAVAIPASLSSLASFHARPGVELDYSGNITLASNWNLGAGIVAPADFNNPALFTPDIALGAGVYSVVPGAESRILADATAIYRVGGSYYNEPGVLSLRAGGNLTLDGSITDGFFQFADQTDPNYLNQALGGGNRVYQGSLNPAVSSAAVTITFPATLSATASPALATQILPDIPYSAAANSPGALGDPVGLALLAGAGPSNQPAGYAGDPLGSAQLFPLLPGPGNGTPVASWSYQLVGGATHSVDPLATAAGAPASVVVQDQNVYGIKPIATASHFLDSLTLIETNPSSGIASYYAPSDWLTAVIADNPGASDATPTTINLNNAPVEARKTLISWATSFFGAGNVKNGKVTTNLGQATSFMTYVSANFDAISGAYKLPKGAGSGQAAWAAAPTLVRTGTGSIEIAASDAIDLRNGDQTIDPSTGQASEAPLFLNGAGKLTHAVGRETHLGGAAVYTAGAIAPLGQIAATDVATGVSYTFSLGAPQSFNYLTTSYNYGVKKLGFAGILISNPVQAQGGGDVTLLAGGDILGRRDTFQETRLAGFGGNPALSPWMGTGDQPWRTGSIGVDVNVFVDPALFGEGLGTLGGGDITVRAGGSISDISLVATDSIVTANVLASGAGAQSPQAMAALGGGSVSVVADGDLLGGRLQVAAGDATLKILGNVTSAGADFVLGGSLPPIDNTLQVRLADGTVDIEAGGGATIDSIGALGINSQASGINSKGFYAPGSGVTILADGGVTVTNDNLETGQTNLASASAAEIVYPGSFDAVSFTGGLSFAASSRTATSFLLYPDARGTLTLLADGNIGAGIIAQLDSDPTLLPGAFTTYAFDLANLIAGGVDFVFPAILPNTPDVTLRALHDPQLTHASDPDPNRIAAGGDITDLNLSLAKATRIAAGQDIINMVFVGQNLSAGDITRVTAGRDITATTALDGTSASSATLPTVQGNTFLLGGPGAFFLEAGRDAGPFLTSAVSGGLTYGGGIIAVGNQQNPWLPVQSADIYTEFGVANGENFAGLISTYLTPANFDNLPGYEFLQTTNSVGLQVADRSHEVYALSLVDWMKSIAADVVSRYDTAQHVAAPPANAPALIQFMQSLKNGAAPTTAQALAFLPQLADQTLPLIPWMQLHAPGALSAAYNTVDVNYDQALAAFQSLPALVQRQFLIKDVYFNELVQTSIPTSPSYLKYSRGYAAVNTLFPATYGYTANNLSGGLAGATTQVETGNLDLRLATIQTDQGGDIAILGPGGEVLAGSVVATSAQPTRRNYVGAQLYSGGDTLQDFVISAANISQIPPGYEGVLTLKGGAIDSFTDGDFLLNQSRAFTQEGGDVALWSSNADVNAGQGPRTTAAIFPAVVHIDEDASSQVFTNAAISGAGIGAFAPDANGLAPDVFLMAPRGTVDAGDAGVRSAGNVFIAAFQVANADAIQAQGTISGAGGPAAVNVSAQTSGDAASAAAAQAAQAASGAQNEPVQRPLIIVDVLGFLPDESTICTEDDKRRGKCE